MTAAVAAPVEVVELIGNPRVGSRTRALADLVVRSLAETVEPDGRGGPDGIRLGEPVVIELGEAVGVTFGADPAPAGAPHSYTVGAGDELRSTWPVTGDYDIHLHGQNGFFRRFSGNTVTDHLRVEVTRVGRSQRLSVAVEAPRGVRVAVEDAYGGRTIAGRRPVVLDTAANGGWYDLTVVAEDGPFLRGFRRSPRDGARVHQ